MAYNVKVINKVDVDVDDLPTVDAQVISLPPVDVAAIPDFGITDIGSVGPVGPVNLTGAVGISHLPDVTVRIREIPSVRAHIPANFRLGFSVLGVELAALHLCGEAQVITEPYVPTPCERCGPARPAAQPQPTQPTTVGAVLRLRNP
ncbi:MAG: hypothetical protein IT361_04805 [Gemmatimonadaceae bacterium]|nr:hypothetical protein [Gemmatimonadaceae bacterium]